MISLLNPLALELPSYDSLVNSGDLGTFIGSLYNLAIALVGLIVFFNFVYAGFLYLTSMGDVGKAAAANKKMTNAVVGIILLLSAYLILNVINPDLLRNNFAFPSISPPPNVLTLDSIKPGEATRLDPDQAKSMLVAKGVNVQLENGKTLDGITDAAVNMITGTQSECGCQITVHGVRGGSGKGVSVDVTIENEKMFTSRILRKYAEVDYYDVFGDNVNTATLDDSDFLDRLKKGGQGGKNQFRGSNTIFTYTGQVSPNGNGTGNWTLTQREVVIP